MRKTLKLKKMYYTYNMTNLTLQKSNSDLHHPNIQGKIHLKRVALEKEREVSKLECQSCYTNPGILAEFCNHRYCEKCILTMSINALKDRRLVPLKCCQRNLPQKWIQEALNAIQYKHYQRFLEPIQIQANSLIDPEYVKMVKDNGWSVCPICGIGVERIEGCPEMHCTMCE